MQNLEWQIAFLNSNIAELEDEMNLVVEGSAMHGHFTRKRDGLRDVRDTLQRLADSRAAILRLFAVLERPNRFLKS